MQTPPTHYHYHFGDAQILDDDPDMQYELEAFSTSESVLNKVTKRLDHHLSYLKSEKVVSLQEIKRLNKLLDTMSEHELGYSAVFITAGLELKVAENLHISVIPCTCRKADPHLTSYE